MSDCVNCRWLGKTDDGKEIFCACRGYKGRDPIRQFFEDRDNLQMFVSTDAAAGIIPGGDRPKWCPTFNYVVLGDIYHLSADQLNIPIDELKMTGKVFGMLKRAGIKHVEDILNMTERELFQVRNLGKTQVGEVKELLLLLSKENYS